MNIVFVLLRFGALILLWVLVIGVMLTVRRDMRGDALPAKSRRGGTPIDAPIAYSDDDHVESRAGGSRLHGSDEVSDAESEADRNETVVVSTNAIREAATEAGVPMPPAAPRRRSAFARPAEDAAEEVAPWNGNPDERPARRPTASLLRVVAGVDAGKQFPLGGYPVVIGRAPSSAIVINDSYASGRHARVYPGDNGSWWVEDLASTNGTFVNDHRIAQPTPLHIGDLLIIGDTKLELVP